MKPATLLFLPYPSRSGTWGSTLQLAAIARACARRGHRVAFHACPPTSAHLRRLGFEVCEFTGAAPRALDRPVASFYDACSALGFDDHAFWGRMVQAELAVIERLRPDAMVSHFRLSAPVSAARSATPLASVAEWSTDPRVHGDGTLPLDELARQLASTAPGLVVDSLPELAFWAADARIATSFPAFEPTLADTDGLVWTGYLGTPDRRSAALPPVPTRLIVAYVSSAPWGTPRIMRSLGRAAEQVGATLWCVTRAGGASEWISPACRLFPYLPFGQTLRHASAIMFHGGKNTAVAAAHYGVAAFAVPGQQYERRYNAQRLRDLGLGLIGELADLRPARLATLFAQLVDEPRPDPYETGLGETGAVDIAADAIEQLITTYPVRTARGQLW